MKCINLRKKKRSQTRYLSFFPLLSILFGLHFYNAAISAAYIPAILSPTQHGSLHSFLCESKHTDNDQTLDSSQKADTDSFSCRQTSRMEKQ